MTEFIKLPCEDWINPAHIQVASTTQWPDGTFKMLVWFADGNRNNAPIEYYGLDAIALAAALDAMAIKEGM